MGKRKSTSTQTNRPIYSAEIEGAANQQRQAYDQAQPNIGMVSNNLSEVSSGLFDQFRQGDPTIQAAQSTAQEMMQGGANPYIDNMLNISNNRVMNQMRAGMATRGQTGGTDEQGIIARALAENETGTRFNQFNQTENRRLQAAGMAPGLLAGSMLPAQMGAELGTQGAMLPLQAAALNSAATGGLLGQYQDVQGRQTQSGGLLGSILSGFMQGGLGSILGGR